MQHSFDVEIAVKYGINQAIILNNLFFWIQKNEANGKHFYDGYYWTYNSKKAFSELLPYMTERQIDYALTKLTKDGLILKGNYNKLPYDRTLWYALTDKAKKLLKVPVKSISQNCKMYQTNLQNGNNENVRPIPDINSDINSDKESKNAEYSNEPKNSRKTFNEIIDDYTENEELRKVLIEHLKTRKLKRSSLTNQAIILGLKKLDTLANTDEEKILIVQNSIVNGWTEFFALKKSENRSKKSKQEPQSYSIEDFASYNIFDSMEE